MIEQTVQVKPMTTYVLSAWARSPRTNQADRWFNAYLGVQGPGNAEAKARSYFPDYHERSVQFTTGPNTTSAVVYFTNHPHDQQAIVDDIQVVEATRTLP